MVTPPIVKKRLENALEKLFTVRQIEIINNVRELKKLTKTEEVQYSGVIKPRIEAIIDFYPLALQVRNKG
jgi:hypothetical protein